MECLGRHRFGRAISQAESCLLTGFLLALVKRETQTIPTVMAFSGDPVGTGFVVSLARPGGNVTGLSGASPEMSGKRLELLKQVVPDLSRVALLWNPDLRSAILD